MSLRGSSRNRCFLAAAWRDAPGCNLVDLRIPAAQQCAKQGFFQESLFCALMFARKAHIELLQRRESKAHLDENLRSVMRIPAAQQYAKQGFLEESLFCVLLRGRNSQIN